MRRLAPVLAAALFIVAPVLAAIFLLAPAIAAPKARDGRDCGVIGNMVFMAGVFAKNGWTQADTLKLYPDLYATIYGERPTDAHTLARLAIAAAYANRAQNPREPPIVFAGAVDFACRQFRGDLDGVLGVDS